jgi:hypothetical protein
MDFHNSYLYTLICKKASFDTLRKAEQVIALCNVEYYLEENCVGRAVTRYEAWQKAFPEGIESDKIPITLQEVCRISDADFCVMPWIYANVLQDLCAGDEPEEGEITAQTELHYLAHFSKATWIWSLDDSYESFDYAYKKFMNADWINEFLEKMEIPWPLTPDWTASAHTAQVKGEIIWPSEAKFKPGPLPASPLLVAYEGPVIDEPLETDDASTVEESPAPSSLAAAPSSLAAAPVRTGPPKVRDEGYWPFMRCKNVYKAYGGTGRLSHHDLLIWLGKKFKMSVESLKKTNPYTLNAKGLPTRGVYY